MQYLSDSVFLAALVWLAQTNRSDGRSFHGSSAFAKVVSTPRRDKLNSNNYSSAGAEIPDAVCESVHEEESVRKSPLSMSVPELAKEIGGFGRARLAWDCYRIGVDPQIFFNEEAIVESGVRAEHSTLSTLFRGAEAYDHESIRKLLPTSRKGQRLSPETLSRLGLLYSSYGSSLEGGLASLSHMSRSSDGTTKLLLRLSDNLEIETVIIPWEDKGRSTLCISSQVGCKQGCTFCATGRMGKLRSLSSDEILAQFFYARKICRVCGIPSVGNVVFMGMGEPADNVDAVINAARILTDVDLFHQARSKVTVSTVAPTPQAFRALNGPFVLAWSVHAARDDLRRKLVPTTRYSMEDLRQGLVDALLERPEKLRATMLEVALMADVNDSAEDALALSNLAKGIIDAVPGIKLVVNLIPFNDIGHPAYQKPTNEAVRRFQNCLWESGIFAHIRTTRGDDESAACGQLATKKIRRP